MRSDGGVDSNQQLSASISFRMTREPTAWRPRRWPTIAFMVHVRGRTLEHGGYSTKPWRKHADPIESILTRFDRPS
jgi:hypothetical protein